MSKASYILAAVACVFAVSTSFAYHNPSKKDRHVNAQKLLGANLHKNGRHTIHKFGRGNTEVAVDVQRGKVKGLSVSGNATIKKYKSQRAMALTLDNNEEALVEFENESYDNDLMFDVYIYVGYAVTDSYGDTYIYWFLSSIVDDPFVDADVYVLPTGI